MSEIDLSQDALQRRREIAEKATQGTWITGEYKHDPCWVVWKKNEFCIAVCQLRVNGENNAVHIALNSPEAVLAMIGEIERLRSENFSLRRLLEVALNSGDEELVAQYKRLEKEADWLAEQIETCPEDDDQALPGIDYTLCPINKEGECSGDPVKCWRKVARKAVESANGK